VDEDKKRVQLSLVFARNTDADAERTKFEARTTSFLRIALMGATVIDAGQANYPYLYLDQAVRYTSWPTAGADGGLSTVEVAAESVYDSTWGKMFEAALLTTLSAIT
jgi:hypothetical protein